MATSVFVRDAAAAAAPGGMGAPASPFLGILPPDMWARPKVFYVQPMDFLGMQGGESRPLTIRMDPGRDFVAYTGNVTARKAGAIVDAPPLLVDLSAEQGQGYNPNGLPVDVGNLFGTARQPAVWPLPLIIPAGTGFVVRLTNAGADALDVRAALLGFYVAR